jgi:hypothetical protein
MPQPLRKPQAEYAIRTTLTPLMAAKYIELNRRPNRALRPDHVETLARDMREGRWQCNGESIIFDRHGNILDGQHRLAAIVSSQTSIETYVVHGLDPEVFTTIDRGTRRNMADVLGMCGEIHRTILAASLVWIYVHEHGGMQAYHRRDRRPTIGELEEILLKHPGLRQSCRYGHGSRTPLLPGLGTALHYLFAQKDATLAASFFDRLASGEHLSKADALYALRERLIKNLQARRKLPAVDIAALTIKAWNAHRVGAKVGLLRWRGPSKKQGDGNMPEEFPAIL